MKPHWKAVTKLDANTVELMELEKLNWEELKEELKKTFHELGDKIRKEICGVIKDNDNEEKQIKLTSMIKNGMKNRMFTMMFTMKLIHSLKQDRKRNLSMKFL